ncbi:NAD(P)/FAD-dependent oxidoreductase [Streptomyces shenzhenensis]|uniref:NAD(P)/FAD-dependent oxidoreductase n=1 Tax=Streptomyces shenzhenensis TaxID=943815 RepID=UPI0015F07982|nr:NAD(P)/FAD-dependent oxidoreductase [Streptomyces shenzhenensis]
MNTYDIAVIGGGAAGLSAALVLARARRKVAVIDAGRPRNAPAAHMQGFLSRDGMPPADLLTVGRTEVAGYGGELVDGTVSGLMRSPNGRFGILLEGGGTLLARRVLVTTGLSDRLPDVPGVTERWGRDLLHCPYCHGHEVRDQPLGVLGGTPGAVQHALLVRQWSPDVVFFAHTTELTDSDQERLTARAIGIVEGHVARLIVENDRLCAVELADGRRVPRTAVFVRPEFVGNHALVRGLGARTDDAGWPLADAGGLTSVPGVWVAGNAANPRAQVITAAGEGSAAGIAINNDLTEEDVRDAVEAFRAGLPA